MPTQTAPLPVVEARLARPMTKAGRGMASGWFGLGTFLSAFLLFQLELIVAKSILPWFGGSPAVWTTCMLFFQLTLLCGYAFAHWSATRLSSRNQELVLIAIVLVALASFTVTVVAWGSPLTPGTILRDALLEHPIAHIFLLLLVCVGSPFFLLSTTGPLLQHWFRTDGQGESAYRLYALSNLGSLFGLTSYPFFLERSLTLHHQAWLWNALFLVYVPIYVILGRRKGQPGSTDKVAGVESRGASTDSRLLWIVLAACGSTMLLATTNLLCEDVVVTPTLWVLPLCLYLLSFSLCFDHPRWYRRWVFYPLYAVSICSALWIFNKGISVDLIHRTDAYLFILFVICMVCHGELARSKPAASELTSFYLMVSLGGVLGGVFATIVAPRVFAGYWEYHIAIVLCGVLALWALLVDKTAPLAPRRSLKALAIALVLFVAGGGIYQAARAQITGRQRLRNFFGVKQVFEKDGIRYLRNGGVEHGGQYLDPARRREGLFYYTKHTAVGTLLTNYPQPDGRGRRIGILGLGTGVLAVYGEPRDTIRFWEIDPQVIELANGPKAKFSYVRDAKANIEIIEADGRLALARDTGPGYDVLVVDVFSGDAIPIHIVTREAFELCMSRLSGPDSVLIFHISNRVVDLTSVMLGFSRTAHVPVRFYMNYNSEYAVFSQNAAMLDLAGPDLKTYPWDQIPSVFWTDDFSSPIDVMRH
jgi:hypothetical protein